MSSTKSPPSSTVWPDLSAPTAPRKDMWIEQLRRHRNDPYDWMRFIPQQGTRTLDTLPVQLHDHLTAEMQYADGIIDALAPQIKRFSDQMRARAPEIDVPLPMSSHGWRYDFRHLEGSAYRLFTRTAPSGEEHILFDEADRAGEHAYYRATDHQRSPDDLYFAWAEDIIGNDRHQICVLDVTSGRIRILVEADAYGYGGFTFSPSSRYLFWIWRDIHSRPTRLYRTAIESGDTVLVYEEHDPAIFMQVKRTAANGFIALTLGGPDMAEVRLIPADAEVAVPSVVRPRERGVTYEVDEWAGRLLMLTDAEGAIDRKLLALEPASFQILSELVAHRKGVPIIAILPFAGTLIRLERHNGLHRLVLQHTNGTEVPVEFDDPAYAIKLVQAQDYEALHVRIVYQTPSSPPRWIDVSLADGSCTMVGQERPRNFNSADYRVERLEALAPDGETIPITVLSRRTMSTDNTTPLLLTGYGAYGISSDPLFSLAATVLVDAGFRYAIAHVRGGSEKGRGWFHDGRRMKKRNSMTDFIACAQHLQDAGYAAKSGIVAHGLSAGGLLVCSAMNIEPELWAGVIAQVPFVDMLNTMSDAEHPLVPLFRPDWGDPLADPEAYDYIASISPYENVRAAPYPPILCTAGLKDDRVPYWEPAKLIANIRYCSQSDNPAVLVLDPDSGHQSSGDQDSKFAEAALFWAFAQHCVAGKSG